MDFSKLKRYSIFGVTVLFLLSFTILIYSVKNQIEEENARSSANVETSVEYVIKSNKIIDTMFI